MEKREPFRKLMTMKNQEEVDRVSILEESPDPVREKEPSHRLPPLASRQTANTHSSNQSQPKVSKRFTDVTVSQVSGQETSSLILQEAIKGP